MEHTFIYIGSDFICVDCYKKYKVINGCEKINWGKYCSICNRPPILCDKCNEKFQKAMILN